MTDLKFDPKLNELEKKQALAALKSGRWSLLTVANAFGISKSTTRNIRYGGGYKLAHDECRKNKVRFVKTYLTDDVAARLNSAAAERHKARQEQAAREVVE